MAEHVLGAEYAERLVQRARDGMAFALCPCCWHGWEWRTTAMAWCGDIAAGTYWVEWYRETRASFELACAISGVDDAWDRAAYALHGMLLAYERALNTLGSLCPSPLDLRHYPTEWTNG